MHDIYLLTYLHTHFRNTHVYGFREIWAANCMGLSTNVAILNYH